MFYRKKDRFSIRKFKVGVGSVFLGSFLLGVPQVYADEAIEAKAETEVVSATVEDTEANAILPDVVPSSVNPEDASTKETPNAAVVNVEEVPSVNVAAQEKPAVSPSVAQKNESATNAVTPTITETPSSKEQAVPKNESASQAVAPAIPAKETPTAPAEKAAETPTTAAAEKAAPEVSAPKDTLTVSKAQAAETIQAYSRLSEELKASFMTRLNQATDAAALELIANEAKRLQKRSETFPNEGRVIPTGTGFRLGETETPTQGRQVTPKVTVDGTHSTYNVLPTLVANPFKVNLSFEGQELHKDDYFYIEGQDVPVELPRKIVITNPDTNEEVVIGTVERVGYESDYYRAQDSQDPTRFDLSASSDYMSKKIKYKVTFNENVEGLKDVKAEINRNSNVQTLGVTQPHTVKFKVLVNGQVAAEKDYIQNPLNNGAGTTYRRFGPGDTKPYLRFNTMLYDFRPLGDAEDIAFSKEVENDAILTFNGEVGGLPNGFVAKIKAKDTNPNPYIWGDNLMLGTRLPVYYMPYDKDGKPQANSTDGSVYVTPKDTYMIIEKISEDKKEATIRFFGDYSRPGIIINGTMHPDKEEAGKTSKFGVTLLKKEWSTANPGNNADLTEKVQVDDPDHPGGSIMVDDPKRPGPAPGFHLVTFFDHNGNPINTRALQTGGNYRYADSARFTALPVTASNPEILNKGKVTVHYVDTDGKKLQDPVEAVSEQPVIAPGTENKTQYDTKTDNVRKPTIKSGDVTYKLVSAGDYNVGTVGAENNLETKKLDTVDGEKIIAANDMEGIAPSGDLMQGEHHVTYVYKAVKGNVDVYFVDENGNTLSPKETDTTDGNIDAAYDTEDDHHKAEITVNGKVYAFKELSKTNIVDGKEIKTDELNHIGGTTGKIKEGTTHVIKVYALKPGSVFVNYEDKTTGQPIANKVTDTDNQPDGTKYDTYDRKPEKLDGTDGSTYYLAQSKPKDGSAPESGEVTAGVNKEVTYLYEKAGNVKVHYVNTQGEEIKAPVDDVVNGKPGSDYETADRKDQTITKGDVTYVFKQIQTGQPGNAPEKGQIKAGEILHVTYVYDVPEKPVEKTGSVFVKFEDKDGHPIKDKVLQPNDENFVIDTDKKPVGDHYETFDNKPEKITTKDDKVYYLAQTEPKENSAPEKGEVTEKDQTVTYIYEQAGSVVVRYVNEQGQLLKDKDVEDETNVKPGTQYNTSEQKDPTITKDDVEYVFKEIQTGQPGNEPENGVVQAGKTLVVTYVYAVKPAPEAPKDPQYATITYYDVTDKQDPTKINEDTKEKLGEVDKTNGVEGENSPYTTVKRLEDYLNKGYELVNDGVPSPITFDGKADNSEDDPSQKYQVTLKHKTTPITPDTPQPTPGTPINPNDPKGPKWPDLANELERTATRTIRYRYENTPDDDTMKVFPDVEQTVKFRRTATVDHVTGKVTYSDWKAIVDEAPAVISGSKEGHTHYNQADATKAQKDVLAQTATISKEGVISGLEDQKILYAPVTPEVPVPIKQHATITYYDVTDPNNKTQLGDVDKESGTAGDKSDYTTDPEKKQKRVQEYLDKGYEVVSDNVPTPIIFDNEVDNSDEDPTQKYEVTLKHAIEPVDPDSPKDPNQPINPKDPDGPKWPDLSKEDLVREATRTIRYRYADKPKVEDEEVFGDIVQTVKFKRTANVDKVTGKIVSYGEWMPVVADAPAEKSKDKAGYTFDKDAPKETAMISKEGVISGIHDQLILYTPVTAPEADKQYATITYYDVTDPKKPVQLEGVDKKEGLAGKESDYTTASRIKMYTDKGWELVSDGVPNPIVFDDVTDPSQEKPSQQYIVTLKHKVTPVTPDTPDTPDNPRPKPGDPVNPEDPRSPRWPNEVGDLVREATRTIRYRYEGKEGNDDEAVFKDVVQKVRFTRTVTMDHVTGTYTVSPWKAEVAEAPAVVSPEKDGYTHYYKENKAEKDAPAQTAMISETGEITGINDQLIVYKQQVGSVIVKYVDEKGNEIKEKVTDTKDAPVGSHYETYDKVESTITTKDGDKTEVYYYKKVDEKSAPEEGEVTEETTTVIYVYEKAGNVVVNYKDKDGKVIKDPVTDEENAEPGKPYDTTDRIEEEIKTPDGKTYKRVPNLTEGKEQGEVPSGDTAKVTYIYEEVKGKVVVHYIDIDGKTIKEDVVDTPESSTGVGYDTMEHKLPTVTKDGKEYELLPALTQGHETGKVVPGTTNVTYVYRLKETPPTPAPADKVGSVVIKYVNTKGETLATDINDTVNAKVGTDYDTTDYKPEKLYKDGKVYHYREVKAGSAAEKGSVIEGTLTVTYVYEEYGNYVPYVPNDPENPNPKDPDPKYELPKVPYDDTPKDPKDNPPVPYVPGHTPKDPNGDPLKPKDPNDPKKGYVPPTITDPNDPSQDTPIPYEPNGGYVPFIDDPTPDPNKPKDPEKVPYDNTPEDPKDNPPLPYVPGYRPKDPNGNPLKPKDPNDPTQGYIPPTITDPNDPTKDTPVPYTPAGTVVVRYKDTDGNVIAPQVTDTPESDVGTPYDTTDHIKPEITFNGHKYVRVPSKTEGMENGKVVKGETVVTYVYQKVGNWIPLIPGVPGKDRPEIPYPFDPEHPDSPIDPTKPNDPNQPNTPPVIPYVPGFEPKDPTDPTGNTPLKPVDPKDPNKGYVPPVPNEPGEDTFIPYVPVGAKVGSVIVHYVNTNGETIAKDRIDTPVSPVGTDYDTTDAKNPENESTKPERIELKDGTVYVLVKTMGAETGKVVEGTTEVTYVYQKVGNWIPEIPGVPGKDRPKLPYPFDPTDPDSPVDPTKPNDPNQPNTPPVIPYVPGYIPNDPNGNPLKPVDPNDPKQGYVPPVPNTPGEDTHIPYVPEKPAPKEPGSYVPHIEDPNPNRPKDPEKVPYDNTPEDPQDNPPLPYVPGYTPKDPNGNPLKPKDPNDPTQGYIPPAITNPEDPSENTPVPYVPNGSYVPHIEDPNPNRPKDPEKVPYDNTPEDPQDNPPLPYVPGYTPKDPNGNPLKPKDPNDPKQGYIPPTITDPNDPTKDTPVPYTPAGTVVVRYKDTDGNVIAPQVTDTPESDVGTPYDTTDHIKPEITFNGHKYVRVSSKTEGMENGKVVKGETVVTYVYQKVGNWIPEIPGVPENGRPSLPYPFDPANPDSPIDPNKPGTPIIPYVPGYTPHDPAGNPLKPVDPNDPSKGYIPPVPKNPGENTHIPYVPNEPIVPEDKLVPAKPIPEKPADPAKPAEPAKEVTPQYMKQGTESLPNTGDAAGQTGMVYGAAALGLTALLAAMKKKSENED
ncbi:MucBP domain-containing protein [Streptococcus himalayensis]|nr:MucBP domain-containing protein [Streptococcus himalayensis]